MSEENKEEFEEKQEDASFAWKKNGFDMREHLTLKTNTLEAESYSQRTKRQQRPTVKKAPKNLPVGLQKIRKKIKEVFDEEDEEEDFYAHTFNKAPVIFEPEEKTLYNALTDEEKRLFQAKTTEKNVKMQQTAGKMEALHLANNLAREAGLNNLSKKVIAGKMQQAIFEPEKMQEQIIKKEVSEKLGIKGHLKDGKIIQAARGIKKVENLGGKEAAKNLEMKDIIKAGEEKLDELKLAELILKKSGQDIKKRKTKFQQGKENLQLKHFENGEDQPSKAQKRPKKLPSLKEKRDFGR